MGEAGDGDVLQMGLYFHVWIDCNGVTFLKEGIEWGCAFSGFWG